MRDDWDRRARENARYYVATHRADWSDEEFFASGEMEVAQQILNDMGNICQGRDPASLRVLEIGCGAGRVTRALAKVFGEVHAVDVSGEMIARAGAALAGLPNVHLYQNNGMDLSVVPDLPFDFAFSVIVFQHIPSRDVIWNYFREIARLLRPGALFKVQVQGYPGDPWRKPEAEPEPEPEPVSEQAVEPLPEARPEPAPPAKLPLHWRLTGKIPLSFRKRFLRPIRRLTLPKPPAAAPPRRPAPPRPAPPSDTAASIDPPEPEFDAPDTWVGVMFAPEDAQAVCDHAGFELRHQHGAGEQDYWLWCFRK